MNTREIQNTTPFAVVPSTCGRKIHIVRELAEHVGMQGVGFVYRAQVRNSSGIQHSSDWFYNYRYALAYAEYAQETAA